VTESLTAAAVAVIVVGSMAGSLFTFIFGVERALARRARAEERQRLTKHERCLRHIAEMERDLGVGPPPEVDVYSAVKREYDAAKRESETSRLVKIAWEKQVSMAMLTNAVYGGASGGAGTPPGVSGGGGTFSGRRYLNDHPLSYQQRAMYGIPPEIVAKY
jgi:hypothetical protein